MGSIGQVYLTGGGVVYRASVPNREGVWSIGQVYLTGGGGVYRTRVPNRRGCGL